MYTITVTISAGGKVVGTLTLMTEHRARARAMVLLAEENDSIVVAVDKLATRPVKFKGVGNGAWANLTYLVNMEALLKAQEKPLTLAKAEAKAPKG